MRRTLRLIGWGMGLLVLLVALAFGVSASRLLHVFASTNAAQLCAGIFLSGRSRAEVEAQSLVRRGVRQRIQDALTTAIDEPGRSVSVDSLLTRPVRAVAVPGRGCVLLPPGTDLAEAHRILAPVAAVPPFAPAAPLPAAGPGPDVDQARLAAAIERNFADPAHLTHSFLVLRDGRVLGERYALGGGPDRPLESWSLGKTLVGVLAGVLATEGRLSLDEPLALPDWPQADDPRRRITVRNALNMAGRLAFTTEARFWPVFRQSDHGLVYTNLPDLHRFAADRPAAGPPGSHGEYNNADPYLVMEHARAKLGLGPEALAALVHDRVLRPAGMGGVVLSTDFAGHPAITGYVLGTARDWARLGLLLANGGELDGRRILDASFVDFMRTPSPGYPEGAYGGAVWLNPHGFYRVPGDAIVLSGAGDQVVLILPRERLVIVRMGHLAKSADAFDAFNASLPEIVAAAGGRRAPPRSAQP
jgi:CubicO group peptidase (beta-lactamase class C family)